MPRFCTASFLLKREKEIENETVDSSLTSVTQSKVKGARPGFSGVWDKRRKKRKGKRKEEKGKRKREKRRGKEGKEKRKGGGRGRDGRGGGQRRSASHASVTG